MKKTIALIVLLSTVVALFAGCGFHVNINKEQKDVSAMIEEQALSADPQTYNADGSYEIQIRYDKGGFEKMDLSQAYVAYSPVTAMDNIAAIEENSSAVTEDIPDLPTDAQQAVDEALGEDQLEHIAIIKVESVDDNTLNVSFTDSQNQFIVDEYYFVIPNEELACTIPVEIAE